MKAIILLLAASIFTSHAQIKHPETDFYNLDKSVYWQHVFEAPNTTKEDLLLFTNQLFSSSRLNSNLTAVENSISFTTDGDIVNYKKYGGREMTTPMILRGEMSYRVTIDIQENRYRVTVKEINFINALQPLLSTSLNESVSKKDEFRTGNGVTNTLKFCQSHFIDKFTKNAEEKTKW